MEPSAQRPGSVRSVASNSSIGSCASLSRRPRTRTRSRTVTGSSSRSDPPQTPTESILPYLNDSTVHNTLEERPVEASITTLPIPPSSSSEQHEVPEIRSSVPTFSLEPTVADATVVEPHQPHNAGKQVHLEPFLYPTYLNSNDANL